MFAVQFEVEKLMEVRSGLLFTKQQNWKQMRTIQSIADGTKRWRNGVWGLIQQAVTQNLGSQTVLRLSYGYK